MFTPRRMRVLVVTEMLQKKRKFGAQHTC